MTWTKIIRIEKSQFNENNLAIFNFQDLESYAVISPAVLKYLDVEEISQGQEIFVIKSIGKDDKGVFFIKNVK